MKNLKRLLLLVIPLIFLGFIKQQTTPDFRIRTITAGISLTGLSDTLSIKEAIEFLKLSKKEFIQRGYEVQTIRIATQSLHELIDGNPDRKAIDYLKKMDQIARRENIILSIGEIVKGNYYSEELVPWVLQLNAETTNISFSIPISSVSNGIHEKSIRSAAEVCKALSSHSRGGEANFKFTASANCPAGIPFFPAAFHRGENSFAIGLESPNLLTRVFLKSDWSSAEENLEAKWNCN